MFVHQGMWLNGDTILWLICELVSQCAGGCVVYRNFPLYY